MEEKDKDVARKKIPSALLRVRLPGFVSDREVGLGDAIKRATSGLGIQPCGGCQQRAALFNRWMSFSGPRPKS